MSGTERLRAMLDERGVEYEVDDAKTVRVTRWRAYGDWVSFIEYDNGDTKFCIDARRLTPEQAIEATLGRGECRNADIGTEGYFKCSKCGTSCSVDWECSGWDVPRFCPNCGARVVEVDE